MSTSILVKDYTPKSSDVAKYRKEHLYAGEIATFGRKEPGGQIKCAVVIRFYRKLGAPTWYACAWVSTSPKNPNKDGHGGARANGIGYDKASEVGTIALQNAGVAFEKLGSPAGRGVDILADACELLAKSEGWLGVFTHHAHA